jgi:regulator of cell morphogenesis and NO signaling
MKELSTQTLAQIVTSNHRTAAIFEKYHLDFCCKGKRSLQKACEEQKISITGVLNEINAIEGPITGTCQVIFPFERLSLTQLIDHIISTHHSYAKKELPQLFYYSQKVAARHGEQHPGLLRVFELVSSIKLEMEKHMEKEEFILFPRIRQLEKQIMTGIQPQVGSGYLNDPIEIMEGEHDHAGNVMAEIRRLTNDYNPPANTCTTYRLCFAALQAFETDLHQHVHLENNILFPKALMLISPPNQCSLRNAG